MLSWIVNSRHTLRLTSPGTCAPPHPQPSSLTSSPSNSFASYSFRTLAAHLKANVSSNPFEITRFRTLCKIPGIGYPPPSILFSTLLPRLRSRSARIAHFFSTSPLIATLAFLGGGGGYPHFNPTIQETWYNLRGQGQPEIACCGGVRCGRASEAAREESDGSLRRPGCYDFLEFC